MNRFAEFHRLHHADRPLLLPNAWDVASAALFTEAGHPAVGTTSLGVAAAAGKPDAAAVTRAETLALARALGRLPSLLTVDIEAGFADDPATVAEFAADLAEAGAVGVNVEDGRPDGGLDDPDRHRAKIAAIKARVPDLFVNARTDTYWLATDAPSLDGTIGRATRYLDAGADAIFVPGIADLTEITELTAALGPAPVNVLFLPGRHTLPKLARSGVARVSTGSLLFRTALAAAVDAVATIRDGGSPSGEGIPSYGRLARLIG